MEFNLSFIFYLNLSINPSAFAINDVLRWSAMPFHLVGDYDSTFCANVPSVSSTQRHNISFTQLSDSSFPAPYRCVFLPRQLRRCGCL